MSDLVNGEYRVVVDEEDYVEVFNLDDESPASVIKSHPEYSTEISNEIENLNSGNKISATIKKTHLKQDNGFFDDTVWMFTDLTILDNTRTYHAFGDIPIVSVAEKLLNRLAKSEDADIASVDITNNSGDNIGKIVTFDRDYEGLQSVFEDELDNLRQESSPPFEVYQTATKQARYFIHYYIGETDSNLANVLRANIEE